MINLINKNKKLIMIIFTFAFLLISNKSYAEVFQWPIQGSVKYVRGLGDDTSTTYHRGWDMGGTGGDDILAAASGEVVSSRFDDSMGNFVIIKHVLEQDLIIQDPDGTERNYGNVLYTAYMHMAEPSPYQVGDTVAGGSVIGEKGSTGASSGPHLHFQICTGHSASYVDRNKNASELIGQSSWDTNGYLILRDKNDYKKACFSPEIIIGKDLAKKIEVTGPSGGDDDSDDDDNDDDDDDSIGNKKKIRTGNRESYYGTGITDYEDILIKMEVSGELIEYGKLGLLSAQTNTIRMYLRDWSKLICIILVFVGVLLGGVCIIYNRNNPEGRLKGITAVGAIGVGALIIGCASLILIFIEELMG